MNTRASPRAAGEAATPQQLELLPPSEVPLTFRLDQRTRRLGLAKVAEIKARLAARDRTAA